MFSFALVEDQFKLHRSCDLVKKDYTYDANGNMVTGGNRSFVWDAHNRVTSVTTGGVTATMGYDYTGIRVKRNALGGTTYVPFDGYEIAPGNLVTKYIRIGIETIGAKKSTGEKLFYHNDHLGSVNVITDITGAKVQLVEYEPWGKVSRSEGSSDQTHGFTGQQLDPESGLYYYGGRYYDPELGRFISADPFIKAPLDPQNLNRYSYVLNSPQNYTDPSGYFHQVKKKGGFFRSIFGRIFISVIVGAITGGVGALAAQAAGVAASAAATFGASMGGAFGATAALGVGGGLNDPRSVLGIFTAAVLPLIGGDFFGSGISGGSSSAGASGGGLFGGATLGSDSGEFFSPTAYAAASQPAAFQRLLSEPEVKKGLNRALDLQASTGVEQGGNILRNKLTGSITTEFTGTAATKETVTVMPPSYFATIVYDVVGQFHTHPVGPKYQLGPSRGDIKAFMQCPVIQCGTEHIVVDNRFVYGFDREGRVTSPIGTTLDILGR